MSAYVHRCALGGSGLTVAIKDTIDLAGLPTMAGSRALADAPAATAHAVVTQRLLDAGCRVIGKTVLHEFAFGMTGINDWAGTPLNPRFPDLIPGGSSSGSAAVVAGGEVDFAIGTDTGGSIRMPAACCGIFGLKPTFGRIDRGGVMPAASTLDCVGPFARDMNMLIRAMEILDPTFRPVPLPDTCRLGVATVEADPVIAAAVAQALAASGLPTVPVALPLLPEAFHAGLAVINAETFAACGHYLASGLVGADVAARLEKAALTTPADLQAAEAVRVAFTQVVDAALAGVDALALPTLPRFPLPVAAARAGTVDLTVSALVRPFNLSGHPALAIPLPPRDGRPVSLQLVGRKGADEALCALGQSLAARLALSQPS